MKEHLALIFFFLIFQSFLVAQITENTYQIWNETGKISSNINAIIDQNISGKQLVLLGEAFHNSGSDIKAKTKFVKYLIKEKGFMNIIFESDFFALYFDHDPKNIQGIWRAADQCKELFNFIRNENVTLWGMDSNLYSKYSKKNFTTKFSEFLKLNEIEIDSEALKSFDFIISESFNLSKNDNSSDLKAFDTYLNALLDNEIVKKNLFWNQSLQSLKSASLTYREKNAQKSIAYRDKQMASNLNFLTEQNPTEKFIVWAANAHIAKVDSEYMGEATMGCEYLKLNPNNSYHIAFSSIQMPYRNKKRIESERRSDKNLVHYLPNLKDDFFLDIKSTIEKNPKILQKKFYAPIWSDTKKDLKLKWFNYFDAIVFVSNGELATYGK